MSRNKQQNPGMAEYIKKLKSNFQVMKVETEMLELKERNLRASLAVYELEPQWEKIAAILEKERSAATRDLEKQIVDQNTESGDETENESK